MGWRVRDARLALPGKPSQGELAQRLGWTQQKVSRIERGQSEVSVDDFHALADALLEDPYYLFTGKRAASVGTLAAQVDRLTLDHWGEDAVLQTAQREARRYAEQQARSSEVSEHVERLVAAGFPRAEAQRAAEVMLGTARTSETDPEATQEEPPLREAR